VSLKDLITSPDFKAYRKAQVRVVASHIKAGIYGDTDPKTIKGALEMARLLIRLPETLSGDKEIIDELNRNVQEDLTTIATEIVRIVMGTEDIPEGGRE